MFTALEAQNGPFEERFKNRCLGECFTWIKSAYEVFQGTHVKQGENYVAKQSCIEIINTLKTLTPPPEVGAKLDALLAAFTPINDKITMDILDVKTGILADYLNNGPKETELPPDKSADFEFHFLLNSVTSSPLNKL